MCRSNKYHSHLIISSLLNQKPGFISRVSFASLWLAWLEQPCQGDLALRGCLAARPADTRASFASGALGGFALTVFWFTMLGASFRHHMNGATESLPRI